MSTRYYLIPFDSDTSQGIKPKYLDLCPSPGIVRGVTPQEITRGNFKVPYYILCVMTSNDAGYSALEVNADVVRLWPDPDLSGIKSILSSLGVNVSSLRGQYTIAQVKTAIYKWMGIDNGTDHMGVQGIV